MIIRMLVLAAAVAAMSLSGGRAHAFDGEPALYEAAKKEKEFTWYTAHYDSETAAAVCNGFDKKYPGVKCNYVRTTAQVAYQRLAQDQKAGIAQASVISSTDASHYGRMKKDGWLLPYKPKNLPELVDAFRPYNDPEDYFVVTAAGLVLITYNTSVVAAAEAPKRSGWTSPIPSGRARSRSAIRGSAAMSAPGWSR
jgi:iron(III) transport system substrate-binding protein